MAVVIIRILCSILLGYGCGLVSLRWSRSLLERRSKEYTLSSKAEQFVSLGSAALGGAVGGLVSEIPAIICGLLLLVVCVTLSVTDWTRRVIPNPVVLAVLGLKLVFGIPALLQVPGFPEFRVISSLVGLASCMVLFALPGLLGKNVGAGDIKLAGAMGFFLGIYDAFAAVVAMGVLVIGYVLLQKKYPALDALKQYIPMGPFIAAGMLISYVAVPYLNLL